jgi:hypothetical protein
MKNDGILMYIGKIYVPNSDELKNTLLREMRNAPYIGNPGYHKSITAIRSQYFWPRMKKEVANYITKCLACRKVKTEHKHPTGLLQPFPILEWKWEVATIYFIKNLPRVVKQHDSIMVVVEKLTKATHFIPVNTTYKI